MTQQCYLLNYTVDYNLLIFNMTQRSLFLEIIISNGVVLPECKNLLIALMCTHAYPDCNPLTQLPIGLCPHECVRYTQEGICRQSFANLAQKLFEIQIRNSPFSDLNCSNPLAIIKKIDESFINHSVDSGCFTFSCK